MKQAQVPLKSFTFKEHQKRSLLGKRREAAGRQLEGSRLKKVCNKYLYVYEVN